MTIFPLRVNLSNNLPTNSRFWSNRPTSGRSIPQSKLGLASLTFHQSILEFQVVLTTYIFMTSWHFCQISQLLEVVLQTESGIDHSNILPTYGTIFGSLCSLALDVIPWESLPCIPLSLCFLMHFYVKHHKLSHGHVTGGEGHLVHLKNNVRHNIGRNKFVKHKNLWNDSK